VESEDNQQLANLFVSRCSEGNPLTRSSAAADDLGQDFRLRAPPHFSPRKRGACREDGATPAKRFTLKLETVSSILFS
jgi:hypothetical protein